MRNDKQFMKEIDKILGIETEDNIGITTSPREPLFFEETHEMELVPLDNEIDGYTPSTSDIWGLAR